MFTRLFAPLFSVWILLIVPLLILVTIWTDRSLEFWLAFAKGTMVEVPWYLSFLMTMILNGFAVPFNLLTELFRLTIA